MMLQFRVKNKYCNEDEYPLNIREVKQMNNIKEALWHDYNNVSGCIEGMEIGSDEYEVASKERDNIRNELIKLEQVEKETKSENKREWIRNTITVVTFVVSTIISVKAINKTFEFDQESTVTSTLGRGILNGVIPKFTKR